MPEELKIRIQNHNKIEQQLKEKGAKFTEEISVVDTYFNSPEDEVIKITEDDSGDFFVNLKKQHGKFQIVKYEKIKDAQKMKKEFEKKHGIKIILKKKRRFFDFVEYKISIELVEDIGEFLILTGENPTKDIIENRLGIKNPEYITVPFSELPKIIDKLAWIRIENKKLLFSRSKGKDKYYIPGGKREERTDAKGVKALESDEKALIREIKEELSVDLIPSTITFLGEFKAQAHGKPLGMLVRMRCYVADYKGKLAPANEIEEVVWLNHKDKAKTAPVDIIIMDWLKERNMID